MRPSTGYAAGVSLHPLAERFASVAENYERGRPEYAPAVIGALAAELGLARGARVLDLAAGTGKLTRALLAAELDVIAVEPQAARALPRRFRFPTHPYRRSRSPTPSTGSITPRRSRRYAACSSPVAGWP